MLSLLHTRERVFFTLKVFPGGSELRLSLVLYKPCWQITMFSSGYTQSLLITCMPALFIRVAVPETTWISLRVEERRTAYQTGIPLVLTGD